VRKLPAGTVTFLFTDIEGSTRLLRDLGDAYADALAAHRRALREAFAAHGGVEVDTQGDAFFVVFSSAADAVEAAGAAQEALGLGPVRVRMGVHTGTPITTAEGYAGLDVHLGARIAASGYGGQVLLSRATRDLLDGEELRDLGEHRLKDFEQPVWIYQLGDALFPPLKTISNTNLPRPASSFVGRERDVAQVISLIRNGARLVTLTGPGGSGKTRLSIEAASELVGEFRNGVFWVGLAELRDASLALETIGQTLGAHEELSAHFGEKELLLLLDNLEQVVDAAPALAALVEACPNLKLLVTSRELLRVRGEVEYEVLPLADPDAVELFCARARLQLGPAIAELCRRLDNMPLALELAAARTKALSPEQILERLSQRLDLFKGTRDADLRQQTLRATIEWSYDLLTADEQQLFARLAVFAGGCTLEAAERVCDPNLDTLQSLVQKSLVRHTGERFWMLETILEYAAERLAEAGEAEKVSRRHAEHFVAFAERAEPELDRADHLLWLDRLEEEQDNFRSALAWSLEGPEPELGLRLCATLRKFWFWRDYVAEGQRWFDLARSRLSEAPDPLRAWVLARAGMNAIFRNEYELARTLLEESLAVLRELGDPRRTAEALVHLGHTMLQLMNHEEALACYEEALALYREAGDPPGIAFALHALGEYLRDRGNDQRARELLEEAAVLARREGNLLRAAFVIHGLGDLALDQEEFDRAAELYTEGLAFCRSLDLERGLAHCLAGLASTAAGKGAEERGAHLWGAVEAVEQNLGVRIIDSERARYERLIADSCERHPHMVEEGRKLSVEEAVERALSQID
jgi:predicted ATPase